MTFSGWSNPTKTEEAVGEMCFTVELPREGRKFDCTKFELHQGSFLLSCSEQVSY